MSTLELPGNSEPYACGLCEDKFDGFEEFYSHLKTHNTSLCKCFHTCRNAEENTHNETLYKCDLCTCRFRSICTLHDHLGTCDGSRSYIFDHLKSTAYPLSTFCSFFETREGFNGEYVDEMLEGNNDPCIEKEVKKETLTVDYRYRELGKFLLNILKDDNYKKRVKKYCDMATDTPDINMSTATNISTRTRSKSARKMAVSKKLTKSSKTKIWKVSTTETEIKTQRITKGRDRSSLSRKPSEENMHISEESSSKNGNILKLKRKINNQCTENCYSENTQMSSTVSKRKRGRPRKVVNLFEFAKEKQNDLEADMCEGLKLVNKTSNASGSVQDEHYIPKYVVVKEERESAAENDKFYETEQYARNDENATKFDSDTKEEGNVDTVLHEKSEELNGHDENQATNDTSKLRHLLSISQDSSNGHKSASKQVKKSKTVGKTAKNKSGITDNNENVLKSTNKRGRKGMGLQTCEICGKAVKKCKMKVHVISHSDFRPFSCDLCPKTYKYQEHLVMHKKSHDDVLPYYCEVCGQGFVDANRLKRHSIMHTDDRPFNCTLCKAGFVTRYKLERHMFVHTGVKRMQCDLCGSRFAHKESLSQHILSIHKQERRFPCPECDKKFFTNYQLKCHTMKHKGIRPYKCTKCIADFIERKELRRHMRKIHKINPEGQLIQDLTETKDGDQKKAVKRTTKKGTSVSKLSVNQVTGTDMSHDQVTCANVSHDQVVYTSVSQETNSGSLPVFVSNLNQAGDIDLNPLGQETCPADSEQHQSCQQSFQGQAEGDTEGFLNMQQGTIRDVHFDHQNMRYYVTGEGQKDPQYGTVPINSRDQRVYMPLYLPAQVKQQREYEGFGAQTDPKNIVYDMLNTSEPKTVTAFGQMEAETSKEQMMYQTLQTPAQTQKNFTVL